MHIINSLTNTCIPFKFTAPQLRSSWWCALAVAAWLGCILGMDNKEIVKELIKISIPMLTRTCSF